MKPEHLEIIEKFVKAAGICAKTGKVCLKSECWPIGKNPRSGWVTCPWRGPLSYWRQLEKKEASEEEGE